MKKYFPFMRIWDFRKSKMSLLQFETYLECQDFFEIAKQMIQKYTELRLPEKMWEHCIGWIRPVKKQFLTIQISLAKFFVLTIMSLTGIQKVSRIHRFCRFQNITV